MLRREFLKTAGAFLASLFVKAETTYRHPVYGKYLGHGFNARVRQQPMELPGPSPYFRAIEFPVEVILETRFEKATLSWVNFNASEDLCRRLEQASPEELFGGIDWSASLEHLVLVFSDPVSIVWELYPETTLERLVPGKTAKFVLSSIYVPFDVKESVDFLLKHCKDARWDVVTKAVETLEKGHAQKC